MVGEGLHTKFTTTDNSFITSFYLRVLSVMVIVFLQCNCLRALSRLYRMGKASQYGDRK